MASTRAVPRLVIVGAVALLSAAAAPRHASDPSIADAEMRGDTSAVRLLLKQGADVNAAQGDGMTALHWAAMHGDVDQTRMLVYAGARLEASTRNGNYTPLHLAAQTGKTSVIKALIQAGADVNAATTSGGATPLHYAAANGNADAIVALLDKGAKVDARESAWSETPLMWAATYNRVNALQVLVSRGADLKAVSKLEDMPAREKAERAALTLRARRVAALKAAEQPPPTPGAVPGRGGPGGASDAVGARGAGNGRGGAGAQPMGGGRAGVNAVETRVPATPDTTGLRPRSSLPSDTASGGRGDRGPSYADLIGNKGGLSALLFAVRQGNTEAVNALLKAGADVNQVSTGDHTSPLLMATINGHFDLAKMLLERGANAKLASDAGTTPLYATINVQWAAKSLYPQPTAQLRQQTTYLELMEALLKAGADPNARLTKHLWYMSYNFDLLGVNTTGATPFWRAAYGTDVAAMKLLLAHGGDPKIPTIKPVGRLPGADAPAEVDTASKDPSGLAPIPTGGPGVFPIHAASGVGYGEGYAANSHQHAPDGWLPSVKYLVEELHADVNARDFNGYSPLHHAAARGDNELILYLVSKGADVTAVSRKGQTVADMANGPVQRIPPFLETIALLEKLGSKNSHKCKSC
jgi:ankyrin repeat protein